VEIGMSVQELNLEQARQKMAAKQDELGKVFEQALVTGGDGRKQYDFNKVTVLGADVKGSIAVAEKVNQMNAELNELGEHVQRLDAAEKAAAEHAARNAPQRGFRLPGGKGDGRGERKDMKSLGDMLAEQGLPGLCQGGAPGGISLLLQELLPSDMLAMGAAFSTMGSKTLMATSAGFAPESLRLPNYVEAATRPDPAAGHHPHVPDRPGRDQVHGGNHAHACGGRTGRRRRLCRKRVRVHGAPGIDREDRRQPAGDG
jgi:hypothetical protein